MTDTHVKVVMFGVTMLVCLAIGTIMGLVTENIITLRNHPEFSEKRDNPA